MCTVGGLSLVVCMMSLVGVVGCDNSCYSDLTCPSLVSLGGGGGAGGSEDRCPTDPVEGPVMEGCGVFVSATLGDDANPGTRAAPVRTITAAISLAVKGPGRVYACAETYEEQVTLPAGISLFGGFDCANEWGYVGLTSQGARIIPTSEGVALNLVPGNGSSLVRDMRIEARDASTPGASSIAVFALPGAVADIRRAQIIAGDGADGASGAAGQHNGAPAKNGLDGIDGVDACAMEPGIGGAAVFLACEAAGSSIGGQGGNGGEQAANAGADGVVAPSPNPLDYGMGGSGETMDGSALCTAGGGGAQGADGEEGLPSASYGRLTLAGYLGAAGGDGKPGLPGQGGGGGGASRGKASCGAAPHGGAGGGSGGAGGCGGRGGKGGQAGGSSIGMACLSQAVSLEDVSVTTGNGGHGGDGGALQPGGQGGLPGIGGLGLGGADPVKAGCAGGAGGYGGNGGNGAGGHGGHSAAIAAVSGTAPATINVSHTPGMVGNGGLGGNPGDHNGEGHEGLHVITLTLEP